MLQHVHVNMNCLDIQILKFLPIKSLVVCCPFLCIPKCR